MLKDIKKEKKYLFSPDFIKKKEKKEDKTEVNEGLDQYP